MTPAEALEASIAHWAKNMQAQTPEEASCSRHDCSLCGLFWADDCAGCPIAQRTGRIRCRATPYDNAEAALEFWYDITTPENRATFITHATAMHDLLVSLRETVA